MLYILLYTEFHQKTERNMSWERMATCIGVWILGVGNVNKVGTSEH